MGTLDYQKCIACEKGFVSPAHAKSRMEAAKPSLSHDLLPENWRDIRWSDESHFGVFHEEKIQIIRKPGERYCPDCTHHAEEPSKGKEVVRDHVWAAVGWDFESPLHFYSVPKNTHGKMSLTVYRGILEEDGDSGHGGGNCTASNMVRKWKEEHHLKPYFNTPGSPDLSPIENRWRAVKQFVRAHTTL